jgi:hypothetical protein
VYVRTWAGPEDERERDGGGDGQQGRPPGLLRRVGAGPRRECGGGWWRAAEAEHGGGLGSCCLCPGAHFSGRLLVQVAGDGRDGGGWMSYAGCIVEWRLRLGRMGATADLFSPGPLTMG